MPASHYTERGKTNTKLYKLNNSFHYNNPLGKLVWSNYIRQENVTNTFIVVFPHLLCFFITFFSSELLKCKQ